MNLVFSLLQLTALLAGLPAPGVVNYNQGFKKCFHKRNMTLGKTYQLKNIRYPHKLNMRSHCRWSFKSKMPIRVNCSIAIPFSKNCVKDALIIEDTSIDVKDRYCGSTIVNFVSHSNVTITIDSPKTSKGGRFTCKLLSSACQCGSKNPDRIVGGTDTAVNEYPMMAGLFDSDIDIIICGATIINKKQLLTAAHCVAYREIDGLSVVVGEHDVTTDSETDAREIYSIASILTHPNYKDDASDIAIITIDGEISFNQKVGPVCLPFERSRENFVGNEIVVLGWGLVEFAGAKATTLQKATLNIIENSVCASFNQRATTEELCTYEAGKDFCQFDSGGPILWENPKTGKIVLIGIAVSGIGCGGDEPAVSTRVGAFIDWIESNKPLDIEYCKIE